MKHTRRTLIVIAALLFVIACGALFNRVPGVVTLEAQSLPITRTLAWDANALSDMVTHYVVRQDGAVLGSPTGTTQTVTITTLGMHTFAVRAVSLWGESVDAVLVVNVVVPGTVRNIAIR